MKAHSAHMHPMHTAWMGSPTLKFRGSFRTGSRDFDIGVTGFRCCNCCSAAGDHGRRLFCALRHCNGCSAAGYSQATNSRATNSHKSCLSPLRCWMGIVSSCPTLPQMHHVHQLTQCDQFHCRNLPTYLGIMQAIAQTNGAFMDGVQDAELESEGLRLRD